MNLYAIRHLSTEHNKAGLLQGTFDTTEVIINRANLHDILLNRDELSIIHFDKIMCSELERTKLTAHMHGYRNFEVSPLLNEISFLEFELTPKKAFLLKDNKWISDPRNSLLASEVNKLEKRLIMFIEENKSNENVLIFSHGCVIRALVSISRFNTIDKMNSLTVNNNELIKLTF
jgi:broad specificity phosphatase PhoE